MSDLSASDFLPPGLAQMDRLLDALGLYGVGAVQKNLTKGNWAPNSPLTVLLKGSSKPLVGNGDLNSSLNYRREGNDVVIGTMKPHARIVHDGGVIRPMNSKYLAIPASRQIVQMLKSMTPRQVTAQFKAAGYNTWFTAAKGSGALIMAQAKTGKPFVLFILKREVRLPPRMFMELDDQAKDDLASEFWRLIWQ